MASSPSPTSPAAAWHLVMPEGAVRWTLASRRLMADLLAHLAALSELPTVRLGIVELQTPKLILAPAAFHLFYSATTAVATEVGTSFVTDMGDIEQVEELFGRVDGPAGDGAEPGGCSGASSARTGCSVGARATRAAGGVRDARRGTRRGASRSSCGRGARSARPGARRGRRRTGPPARR